MGQIERTLKRTKTLREAAAAQGDSAAVVKPDLPVPPAAPTPREIDSIAPLPDQAEPASQVHLNPEILTANRILVAGQKGSAATSAYKMLRTRVLQRMRANHWSRLGICSARANAGKTITAINTAISLASDSNQNVILVDLDLRKPSVHHYLGIEHAYGLSDYLLGDVPLNSILLSTDVDRLSVIANQDSFEDSSEMLTSKKMTGLIDAISPKGASNIVIFDFPPLLDADDLLAFSPQLDALLFVVAERETRRSDLQLSYELIQELNLLGVVLNKSSDEVGHYYY